MQKALIAVLSIAFVFFTSCQKEISLDNGVTPSQPQPVTDTLKAIVFDGNYTGGTLVDYDSAVISYGAQFTSLVHYSDPATLYGTEVFNYDNNNRVTAARFTRISGGELTGISYSYNGADSFPQQVLDTTVGAFNHDIRKYVLANPVAAGAGRRFTVYEDVRDLLNPFSFLDTTTVLINAASQLQEYTTPSGFIARYLYNSSGDVDSSFAKKPGGEESYFAANYTATANPLPNALRRIYKNLLRFSVTDALDNSALETALDICYLPSELISQKVPQQARFGYYGALTERLSFNFTIQNNLVTQVILTSVDLPSGVIQTSRVKFYYR